MVLLSVAGLTMPPQVLAPAGPSRAGRVKAARLSQPGWGSPGLPARVRGAGPTCRVSSAASTGPRAARPGLAWHTLPPALPPPPGPARAVAPPSRYPAVSPGSPRPAGQRTRASAQGSGRDALPGAVRGSPAPPGTAELVPAGEHRPARVGPALPHSHRSTYRERRRRLRLHVRPGTHQAREGRRRPEPGRAAWAAPAPPGQVPRCPVSAGPVTAGSPGLLPLGPERGAPGPPPASSAPEPDYISQ